MKTMIKMIKGGFIGMGNILPGISGSMIAVILNIYKELIDAVNQLFTHPIKAILSIWEYMTGAVIGIIIGLIGVSYLLDIAPLPITLLFVGFIVGAIPTLYKDVKKIPLKWHHGLIFVITAILMLSVLFIKQGDGTHTSGFWYNISVIVVGIIYAIAMIIPGLSGATMLMAFGFYQILLDMVSIFKDALTSQNYDVFFQELPLLLLLMLGAIIGLVVMGKLMAIFMKKYPQHFIYAVLGIVVVSPINILVLLQQDTTYNVYDKPWYMYVLSFIMLGIGILLTLKLAKYNKEEGQSI